MYEIASIEGGKSTHERMKNLVAMANENHLEIIHIQTGPGELLAVVKKPDRIKVFKEKVKRVAKRRGKK